MIKILHLVFLSELPYLWNFYHNSCLRFKRIASTIALKQKERGNMLHRKILFCQEMTFTEEGNMGA